MKAKKSGTIERMAHSFYLYPELTRPQNIIRGVAWSASWIISIFIPRLTQSDCSLGGAYIVFSIALLLEFISISRGSLLAQLTHGIFIALLVAMLLLSIPLSFISNPDQAELISILGNLTYILGWIVTAYIVLGLLIACIGLDTMIIKSKQFQNENNEMTDEQKLKYKQFMDNLTGNTTQEDE